MRREQYGCKRSRRIKIRAGGATRQHIRRGKSGPALQALCRRLEDGGFWRKENGACSGYAKTRAACLRDWVFVWDILEGGGSVYGAELGHWAAALLRDFCLLVWLAGEDGQSIADALLEE